ncbi:MAG: trehalose-6-phosphate synthase [Candidatus Omnitrophica bacterium]|nr:trehalose-6-phosphate synthase [Candidatus Omnitrophota bacterium]
MQQLIKEKLSDYLFIVVSNRQPYVHIFKKGNIECQRGAGGVITALDPVMQVCDGIWVAYGNGEADRKVTDAQGKVRVPPQNPAYTLKRIWLTRAEEEGYYYGYSNEALWPLCHTVFQRPIFNDEDWQYYIKVNQKFAEAVAQEIGGKKAFVFIQDYHFTLLPKFLKELLGNQVILAHFWHIPWPSYEAFRICPQRKEILEGLLFNDLLGFHIRYHCDNFLETVDRELEAKIDRERFSVIKQGHETIIRPYPISVDFEGINDIAQSNKVKEAEINLRQEFGLTNHKVLLGLDRIDYTKGIPERISAIDLLLKVHPELKQKIVFVQMGELSRLHISKYKALNDELNALVEEINWKHQEQDWKPIILVRRHLSFYELLGFYKMGDVCIVSSLHDGMNLVAKEFLSSRFDEKGVLVLSQFTGASRELTDAILINPYDLQQFAEALWQALILPEDEVKRRNSKMRSIIQQNNIYRWAGKIISELLKFEFKE